MVIGKTVATGVTFYFLSFFLKISGCHMLYLMFMFLATGISSVLLGKKLHWKLNERN